MVEYLINPDLKMNENINLDFIVNNIFIFPLLGYFLQHKISCLIDKVLLIKIWMANGLGIFVTAVMTNYRIKNTAFANEGDAQYFFNAFVLINCVAIFLTVKYITVHYKIPIKLERLILKMGGCTFGIYLIHPILMWQILDHINFCRLFIEKWHLDYMPAGILFTIVIWGISLILVMILKLISGIRNLI